MYNILFIAVPTFTVRVPKDLKERIEKTAEKQGVSMNQFAIYAFAREIAELETTAFFQNQYGGKNKREILEAFDAVMSKQIPNETPPDWDQLDI